MLFIWKKVDVKKKQKQKNIGSCPQVPVFQNEKERIRVNVKETTSHLHNETI
jgi:hypothetical protein